MDEIQSGEDKIERFMALVERYRDCTEYSDEVLRQFVEKVIVHENVKDEDGEIRAFRNLVVLAQEKLLGGCSLSNGVSVQDNGSDTSKVENPISIRRDALLCLMSCSLIRLMPAVLVWVSRVLA